MSKRKDRPETIQYAKVLDGCSLDIRVSKEGCFQMGMITALFSLFESSEDDI
ncbi:hypothetical protein DFH28DRAFT_1011321 [Melampsora americana]|nr:hypothetical protein DFH28DRAFT_1011321 [Melampsora americana]